MYLKGRKFLGLKFKRQVVIGPYIYDFSCFEKKLIIELDGSQHKLPEEELKDNKKQAFAEESGYKILRFNNNDLDSNLVGVLEVIRLAAQVPTSSVTKVTSSPGRRRGSAGS